METRTGNIPKLATGLIYDTEEHLWAVYRLKVVGNWVNLKVVHRGPIAGAANYWVAWNTKDKRLAQTHDAARMALAQPKILSMVLDVMKDLYPDLTEEDMALPK